MNYIRVRMYAWEYKPVIKRGENFYCVHYLPSEVGEDETISCYEMSLRHKPTEEEMCGIIENQINAEVQNNIVNGFVYNEHSIYLSTENQQNYTMAMTTGVTSLKVKCSSDENCYLDLTTKTQVTAFVKAMQKHIQQCLEEGWSRKDCIDVSVYGEAD